MKLRRFERRWLAVVFDTLLPSGADPRLPLGARDVPLDRLVDDLERGAPLRFLLGLRVALWACVLCPLFLMGRARLLPSLPPGERIAALERLRAHRVYAVRELVNIVKAVACLGYCGLPEVQRRMGLTVVDADPPSWARE